MYNKKKTRLAIYLVGMLLFSIVILDVNSAAYGNKLKQIFRNFPTDNPSSSNHQLTGVPATPHAVQQVLQIMQTQIALTSSQDKATKALKQINSIVQLDPNGPLSQSLSYLARQQEAGNTDAVTQVAVQVAAGVANGSNDNIAQIIEQAILQSQQGVLSSSKSSSSSSSYSIPSPNSAQLSSSSSSEPRQSLSSSFPPPATSSSPLPASSSPSSLTTTQSPSNTTATTTTPTASLIQSCSSLPISGITAKGDDGHDPAQKAIDNNLGTQWTMHGIGVWIQPDLGKERSICSVDIAWYRGNLRQNNFVISVANDTSNFTKVFSGTSSGTTLSYERYSFEPITARYVKITVNGNTENAWSSIAEIKVNGFNPNMVPVATAGPNLTVRSGTTVMLDGSASRDPDGEPVKFAWTQASGPSVKLNNPNGPKPSFVSPSSIQSDTPMTFKLTVTDQHGLSATHTVQVTTKPVVTLDEFGIRKIYPTKSGGEEWFMNMVNTPSSDKRVFTRIDSSSFTKNADGSWKITKPPLESRLDIFTSSGYNQDLINTYDQSALASKGYMQSPTDWKNVEMTGYLKINSYSDASHAITLYSRGGFHSTTFKCEGTAYKGSISYAGQTQFQKEQWDPNYLATAWKQATSSDPKDRWIGFKYIVYNTELNGKPAVKMENWLDDKADGNWVKVDEHVDSGGWGTSGTSCGGSPDQLITWGGPVATFSFDGITDLDFKNLSVREIEPPPTSQ